MSKQVRNALFAAIVMMLMAGLAWAIAPTHRIAVEDPIDLEKTIPARFGDWQIDAEASGGVVNPQQAELLNKLYSQIVSRTYVNQRTGVRVMLSIAYGEDQRDGMQMHYPEICYPAQGFEVRSNTMGKFESSKGTIPLRRLETVLGGQRYEPVTYWTMIGNQAVLGGTNKKLAELRYGLRGQIVDGLLFRISSIDRNSERAFNLHSQFVTALLDSLGDKDRIRLSGTGKS